MTEPGQRTKTYDVLQGVCAVIGITFGLIPLVKWFIDGTHNGPFRFVFGTPTGAMAYLAPVIVIIAVFALIALFEGLKRRT